jgi:hypothetical protein
MACICCNQFVASACSECCPSATEIPILIDGYWSWAQGTYNYRNPFGGSSLQVPMLFNGVTLSAAVVVAKTGACSYYFNGCGSFGDFNRLEVNVVFNVVNSRCIADVNIFGEFQGCACDPSLTPASSVGGFCNNDKAGGVGSARANLAPFGWPASSIITQSMSTPCSFDVSMSGSRTFSWPIDASPYAVAGGSPLFRGSSGGCSSYGISYLGLGEVSRTSNWTVSVRSA